MVQFYRSIHYTIGKLKRDGRKRTHESVHDILVDVGERFVIKGGEGEDVKVAQVARRNGTTVRYKKVSKKGS